MALCGGLFSGSISTWRIVRQSVADRPVSAADPRGMADSAADFIVRLAHCPWRTVGRIRADPPDYAGGYAVDKVAYCAKYFNSLYQNFHLATLFNKKRVLHGFIRNK